MTPAHGPVQEMRQTAQESLRLLDKVLAQKPEKNGHDFSAAVRHLAALRDRLLADRCREKQVGINGDQLARLNAVISLTIGGEFPIGPVPWKHVEAGRDSLAALVAELNL